MLANYLLVADITENQEGLTNGKVWAYTRADPTKFIANLPPPKDLINSFHPRGVVIDPDGKLYVSNVPNFMGGPEGQVLRYDPRTLDFRGVFASSSDKDVPNSDFNRPEGLVFGPDGNLYVTSFKTAGIPNSADKILIFAGPRSSSRPPGAFIGAIDLDQPDQPGQPPQPRSFAEALVFGPGGFLYTPINNTGGVRRYNVATKTFDLFVNGGDLKQPWYLTFGNTDPATLNYTGL